MNSDCERCTCWINSWYANEITSYVRTNSNSWSSNSEVDCEPETSDSLVTLIFSNTTDADGGGGGSSLELDSTELDSGSDSSDQTDSDQIISVREQTCGETISPDLIYLREYLPAMAGNGHGFT